MPTRRLPFRKKPNEVIQARIDAVLNGNHKIFLMQELGPTLFIVKEEFQEPLQGDGVNLDENRHGNADGSGDNVQTTKTKKYKVAIGDMQRCTCGCSDICVHILFIMLKVLRVPKDNPVVWQHCLLEREINDCLSGRYRALQCRRPKVRDYLKRSSKSSCEDEDDGNAKRRQVEDGDTCPVCLDDLTNGDAKLTFCKHGCGKQAHLKCMIMYAEHQKSVGKKVTCPLCRADWGQMALYELKSELASANTDNRKHPKVCCCHCPSRTELVGLNYRCLVCNDYDLCPRCFRTTAVHAQHPFVYRETPCDEWKPAPRVPRRNAQVSQRRRLQQASSASSSLVRQIQQIQQYREFNSNDYELLLRLDEENRRQQRRLNTLTGTNDLYQDNSSITIPLAVYLVQCIKACYTTFNTRTRANLNYNLKSMTNSCTCVQCNGRMSGTDNPIRLICGDWVHGECVEKLISSSMPNLVNNDSHDSNRNMNQSTRYPCCPKCKQCLYPGLKSKKKKLLKNRKKKINDLKTATGDESGNTFVMAATGIRVLSMEDTTACNAESSSAVKFSTNSSRLGNAKFNASKIKGSARKNRLLAGEKSAEKLVLNVSAHSVSATSLKPGRIFKPIPSSNVRRLHKQSRISLRRSRSAGCNKGANLKEVTAKRDSDGTNEAFVLEATSLAPARIKLNDNTIHSSRQLSSSSARLRYCQKSKKKASAADKTTSDHATECQKNNRHFGSEMMNGVILSKKVESVRSGRSRPAAQENQDRNGRSSRITKKSGRIMRGLTFSKKGN